MFTKDELKILDGFRAKARNNAHNAPTVGWKILYTQLSKVIEDIAKYSINSHPPPEPKQKKMMQ